MLLQTSFFMLPFQEVSPQQIILKTSQVTLLLLSAKRPRQRVKQLHVTCVTSIHVTWWGSWVGDAPNPFLGI